MSESRGKASHYVHGSEPGEQARLSLMNEILNAKCVAELALRGGERILDVGCGLGQFALEMARYGGPATRVIGIERDGQQLAAGRVKGAGDPVFAQIELRQGDAYDLPLMASEWGTFDVVWSRFLLEHVPDPQRVVDGMVRALAPGGRIVLCDDDHDLLRLDPPAPRFMALWNAYQMTYSAHGNDPLIGRRLPRLIHAAGARLVRNHWIFFGSCAGASDWRTVIDNCRGVVGGSREQVLAHITPREFDAAIAEYDAWSELANASFWLPLAWAEGRRV
jgi:ubiquinone/menaquinone biosynthesis C-methylase UbiE